VNQQALVNQQARVNRQVRVNRRARVNRRERGPRQSAQVLRWGRGQEREPRSGWMDRREKAREPARSDSRTQLFHPSRHRRHRRPLKSRSSRLREKFFEALSFQGLVRLIALHAAPVVRLCAG
jgi:hypothetical protein